jgi:hypothetical protein
MSNDSSNTFFIVKTIDTTTNKTVSSVKITNSEAYTILDATASEIVNNDFPLSATEQEVVDNALVYGDVELRYKLVDSNGDKINTNTPFSYTATGVESGTTSLMAQTGDTLGDITVTESFVSGKTYLFTIRNWDVGPIPNVYKFTWKYQTGWTGATSVVTAGLDNLFSTQDPAMSAAGTIANFTVTDLDGGTGLGATLQIDQVSETNGIGLNTDFRYKYGIVWMDDKGRNAGVTNSTDVSYDGTEWTFNIVPNIGSTSPAIEPPYWATKYMFVRTKINTSLMYFSVQDKAAAVDTDYDIYKVRPDYYTNYIAARRGQKITIFSKELNSDVEVEVLSDKDKTTESITDTANDYIYVLDDYDLTDFSICLYKPVKDVETKADVYYETSDVFAVYYDTPTAKYVFEGDVVSNLNSYDTAVGRQATLDFPIMKTDIDTLLDINHLGRGAYTTVNPIDISENATIVHSQRYAPDSNYNGLGDFSYSYNNVKDLEQGYGSIEKLYYDNGYLLVGQRRRWSRIPIDKSILSSADGGTTLVQSKTFFGDVVSYNGEWGITDKRSFESFGFGKYFVDRDNAAVCRLSMDGITVLNNKRGDEIVDILRAQEPQDAIIGGFDVHKNEYIVALETNKKILRFSQTSKESVGDIVLDYIPKEYINLNSRFYSISPFINNTLIGGFMYENVLFEENVGSNCFFYGREYAEQSFSFAVNMEPNIIKDFLSVSSNDTTSGAYDPAELKYIYPFDIRIDTNDSYTTLDREDLLNREEVWYGDFMKDEISTGAAFYGAGELGSTVTDNKVLTLSAPPANIRYGDTVVTSLGYTIGVVESVSGNDINLVSNMISTPVVGDFIGLKRPAKVEGKSIKGRVGKVTFSNGVINDSIPDYGIYGVTTNINLSSNTE